MTAFIVKESRAGQFGSVGADKLLTYSFGLLIITQ